MRRLYLPAAIAMLTMSSAALAAPAMPKDVGGKSVLVGENGMTLYTYDKDAAGKSNCNGKCETNWPPLKAEADAKADGEWSVVTRDDGSKMWAYDGKPLYFFVKDTKAGDMTGEGVGKVWHIATPK